MKKNLLYLFALVCSMAFFTACSDDDENTGLTVSEIVGDYTGSIQLALGDMEAQPLEGSYTIHVTAGSDASSVNVQLDKLTFESLELGPIPLEDCAVAINGNTATIKGSGPVALGFLGTVDVTMEGTSNGSTLSLDIDVPEAPMVGTVVATFEGTK